MAAGLEENTSLRQVYKAQSQDKQLYMAVDLTIHGLLHRPTRLIG